MKTDATLAARNLQRAVIEAPALFNRATRRAVGLTSRYWRWDLNASEETRRIFLPRYIRRHFDEAFGVGPNTRRRRRARARVSLMTKRRGMLR